MSHFLKSATKHVATSGVFPGFWNMIFLVVFLVLGACSEAVVLTPEQKSLFDAWNVTKEFSHDFDHKDQTAILAILDPSLRSDGHVESDLSALFLRLDHIRLHLTADSAMEDDSRGTMILRSHWVLSGMVVGAKAGEGGGYLKAGECRLVVRIPGPGAPAVLMSVTGDDFLRVEISSRPKAG